VAEAARKTAALLRICAALSAASGPGMGKLMARRSGAETAPGGYFAYANIARFRAKPAINRVGGSDCVKVIARMMVKVTGEEVVA
jgi:hypothetical protein